KTKRARRESAGKNVGADFTSVPVTQRARLTMKTPSSIPITATSPIHTPARKPCAYQLRGRFIGHRLGRKEVGDKSFRIGIEKRFHSPSLRGPHDQPSMVVLGNSIGDLRVRIGRSVRILLPRQTQNHARILV